ncbi:MAG: hypothetical protein DRJ64_08265, partial [Thermoprotei archaeon]
KGFNYYAGGHVHEPLMVQAKEGGWITMPGPLFPNNFAELEKLDYGSMILCEVENGIFKPKIKKIPLIDLYKLSLDCNGKSSEQVSEELELTINPSETDGKLVLLRLSGTLSSGKLTDINYANAYKKARNAFLILRNTAQLHSMEFEDIKVKTGSVEDVEKRIVEEHESGLKLFQNEKSIVRQLLVALSKERAEGETKASYEDRMLEEFVAITKPHKSQPNS